MFPASDNAIACICSAAGDCRVKTIIGVLRDHVESCMSFLTLTKLILMGGWVIVNFDGWVIELHFSLAVTGINAIPILLAKH